MKSILYLGKYATDHFRNISHIYIFLLTVLYIFPLLKTEEILYASFTDDFYYYLKIAKNYNTGNGLSFHQDITTNGFQPIHQWVIIALSKLALFFNISVLPLIRFFFGFIFFFSSILLLRRFVPKTINSQILFLIGISGYFVLSYSGMEVLLIIPVMSLWSLYLLSNKLSLFENSLWIILLFFLRIDTIVITIIATIVYFNNHRQNLSMKIVIASFLCITVPIFSYAIINLASIGYPLPISGLAKSVNYFNWINSATIISIIQSPITIIIYVITSLSIPLLFFKKTKKENYCLLAIGIALIFTYYLVNSIRSDWPIWTWYYYPFIAYIFFSSAIININPKNTIASKRIGIYIPLSIYLFITVITCMAKGTSLIYPVKPYSSITQAALKIRNFERNNPGIYAMGDRAGLVGFVLESKLLQIEGLVMDKQYIDKLNSTYDILDLLQNYNIDYYIATNPKLVQAGYYLIKEPSLANNGNGKIISEINWPIAYEFTEHGSSRFLPQKNVIRTIIFKVPK